MIKIVENEENNDQESEPITIRDTQPKANLPNGASSLTSSLTYTKLQNLKSLYEEGFITETEYTARKSQLIDQLTGTSMKKPSDNVDRRQTMRTAIPRQPPNWDQIEAEKALKIYFDPTTRIWNQEETFIKVDSSPFAKGGLRLAYHMTDLGIPEEKREKVSYVLKTSIDPYEDVDVYYRDVEMQLFAKIMAEKFNVYNPPKKVSFVKAWLLKLLRRGDQVCAVERFISGPYRKHNNNFGFVNEDERNTPQAFSHFSYEASDHQLLICDIQGVADLYTDPQIHTVVGDDKGERPFGKGNLGQRGIDQFLKTHRCNPICRYLKLPPINPKIEEVGTVPVDSTLMQPKEIDVLNIRVLQLAGGRLGVNAVQPGASPPDHPPDQGPSKPEHLPLITGNKKTKITITAEQQESTWWCTCCTIV